MPRPDLTLWQMVAAGGFARPRFVSDSETKFHLQSLAGHTTIQASPELLRNRVVMIIAASQLQATLAMIELDGLARRIVLCPPDLATTHLESVITQAEVDIVLAGEDEIVPDIIPVVVRCNPNRLRAVKRKQQQRDTQWLLFTSGTTGAPKMAIHSLASLAGAIASNNAGLVWSSFYDIRRFGGLQILLRALAGGGSMVLSDAREAVSAFLARAAAAGVSHISGTPTHWRRALMSLEIQAFRPDYIRLSGEVADQAILNHLRLCFPKANIAHAFASTEAGVAFDVQDGKAGFPAALVGQPGGPVEMRVRDGSLHIRSARIAIGYAGDQARLPIDADGFIDTGDIVELRDGRYHFNGRREGQINIGGQKVHPEEIEAVINQHPAVLMSCVRGRPSPITGAIVVADIVMLPNSPAFAQVRDQIMETCRRHLPAHKVPVMLKEVNALDIGVSGKLLRRRA